MADLGQTKDPAELVTGSPAGLRTLARELYQLAGQFDNTANGLGHLDPGGSWGGSAGNAFQNYFAEEPVRWRRAADSFRTTAESLNGYAGTLEWAQGQAGEAIRQWDADDRDTARDTLSRAREQVESAASTADGRVDGARDAAPEAPRLAARNPLGANEQTVPTVYIDADRHPETARHVREAQTGSTWRGDKETHGAPHPSTVTIDRPGAKQNRKDSLRGIPTKRGYDRDEYPPAMFDEGGKGASVKYIDPSDNRGAGSSMRHQLDALELDDGERVNIVVINEDENEPDDEPDEPDEPDDGGDDGDDGGDGGDDGGGDDGDDGGN
jgi:hypothetical protein